jgi:retron-type reverse transcriptase
MKIYTNIFRRVVTPKNLFVAWDEFHKGKQQKKDVMQFERELEQNIFDLHYDLKQKTYTHGPYHGFMISDPKIRSIHKANVRDRVVHHALFNTLYSIFAPTFIADSFSCQIDKGTHKGVEAVQSMIRKVSKNGTSSCYVLKCDIRKFFGSIDHDILLTILHKRIKDPDLMWLIREIIGSYTVLGTRERERERESDVPESPLAISRARSLPIST